MFEVSESRQHLLGTHQYACWRRATIVTKLRQLKLCQWQADRGRRWLHLSSQNSSFTLSVTAERQERRTAIASKVARLMLMPPCLASKSKALFVRSLTSVSLGT